MASNDKSVPRILQQQPPRDSDEEQQQSGSSDFQPQAGQPKDERPQMGEGSYEATRDYQKDIEEYLKRADIDADMRSAKPRSQQEARELEQAEKEGKSHSKGER